MSDADVLGTLAEAFERMSAGTSPTGNYFFAVNAADAAASLKRAADRADGWIPVGERLPEDDAECLAMESDGTIRVARFDAIGDGERSSWYEQTDFKTVYPVAWMLPPEPPEVT